MRVIDSALALHVLASENRKIDFDTSENELTNILAMKVNVK